MSCFSLRPALGLAVVILSLAAKTHAADKPQLDPQDQRARQTVKSALLAEASGDNAKRAELLKSAAEYAPNLAEANWHLGRINVAGKWKSPADAQQQASSDPRFAEYRELRAAAEGNTKLIRNLARWCLKQDLEDVARVHFAQLLTRNDADAEMREEAVRRLDLHYMNGRWMTGKEIAEQQYKTQVIEDSLAKWRPRLKKLQVAIDSSDERRKEKAIEEFRQLDQPQIIPALESFLVDGGDRFQEEAVKQLAKLPPYEATEALAQYAVLSPYVSARDTATTALRERPLYESCPLLFSGLTAPLKTQYRISEASGGRIIYVQAVRRDSAQVTQTAFAKSVSTPVITSGGPRLVNALARDVYAQQIRQQEINKFHEAGADARLQARLVNDHYESANRSITSVLASLTGTDCGNNPAEWWEWWQDYNQKWWPRTSEYICSEYQRTYAMPVTAAVRHSCFVAGTLIHTETGLAKIETVTAGDRVLAQDQETGELAYRVVRQATVRPPAKILVVRFGTEDIRTTLGHPFWVSGQGWKLAKDLRVGDLLHALNGACRIETLESASKDEQAYNLIVEDFHSYFVGNQGLLVHDNEFRKPTRAVVPGLVASAGASASK